MATAESLTSIQQEPIAKEVSNEYLKALLISETAKNYGIELTFDIADRSIEKKMEIYESLGDLFEELSSRQQDVLDATIGSHQITDIVDVQALKDKIIRSIPRLVEVPKKSKVASIEDFSKPKILEEEVLPTNESASHVLEVEEITKEEPKVEEIVVEQIPSVNVDIQPSDLSDPEILGEIKNIGPYIEKIKGITVVTMEYWRNSIDLSTLALMKSEIDGALLDLESDELELLKSINFNFSLKGDTLPPTYYERTKRFDVHPGNSGEDILNVIRTSIIPSIKGVVINKENLTEEGKVTEILHPEEAKEEPIKNGSKDGGIMDAEFEMVENKQENVQDVEGIEQVLDWKNSEEWKAFEEARNNFAKNVVETERSNTIDFNLSKSVILEKEYNRLRNNLAEKVKNSLRSAEGIGPLTVEQTVEFNSKANDAIFEELVQKEHDSYISALRENRGASVMDKTKEAIKYAVSTKAFSWYVHQNKWTRAGINTALATIVFGSGLGLAGALGYGALRATRVGTSMVASGAVGAWAQNKWSVEESIKNRDEKIGEIRIGEMSLDEKVRAYGEEKERSDKEIQSKVTKQIGATVAAGVIAGSAVGAIESMSGAKEVVLNAGRGNTLGGNIADRLPPRAGYGSENIIVKDVEKITLDSNGSVLENPKITLGENIFQDDFVPIYENLKVGDSHWRLIEKTLDHSEKFKNMGQAEKTWVISNLVNKLMKDPATYGAKSNGLLTLDSKVDYTKLFEDKDEVGSILDKASNLSEATKKNILETNAKIAAYVEANPKVTLDASKVSDILSTKVPIVKPVSSEYFDALNNVKSAPKEFKLEDLMVDNKIEIDPKSNDVSIHGISQKIADLNEEATRAYKVAEMAEANRSAIVNTTGDGKVIGIVDGIKPKLSDVIEDPIMIQRLDNMVRTGINSVYGSKGILGIGKVEGIFSTEWRFMGRLPAKSIIDYYTSPDSNTSGLVPEVARQLASSPKHMAFGAEIKELIAESGGVVKPLDTDTVETYIRRLCQSIVVKDGSKISLSKIAS